VADAAAADAAEGHDLEDSLARDSVEPHGAARREGREPSLSEGRYVRVRSLGEVAAALGRLGFP
jgi:hypothetical protein